MLRTRRARGAPSTGTSGRSYPWGSGQSARPPARQTGSRCRWPRRRRSPRRYPAQACRMRCTPARRGPRAQRQERSGSLLACRGIGSHRLSGPHLLELLLALSVQRFVHRGHALSRDDARYGPRDALHRVLEGILLAATGSTKSWQWVDDLQKPAGQPRTGAGSAAYLMPWRTKRRNRPSAMPCTAPSRMHRSP